MQRDRLPALTELAALVEASADEQIPAARLRAAIELSRELTDLSDALIGRFVADAREAGLSWTEIGRLFGTSKQAAQQRYGRVIDEPGQWPGSWTPAVRQVLNQASHEARELRHNYVGTEHALLALVTGERSVAADVLRDLGVARDRMLATPCMQPGSDQWEDSLPLMPRLKQALEHSRRIADGLEVRLADTEHLLAGIVAVPDSMAVEILRRLGASASDVREMLAEQLDVPPSRLGEPRRRRRRRLLGATS